MKCKHCGSLETNKTGFLRSGVHQYQKYICRKCYRYTVIKVSDVIAEVGIGSAETSAMVKDGESHAS